MKRLLMIALMIWLPVGVGAQAVNPRNTFVNATNANNPSLWLNFNDANTNFVDSISGLAFSADNLSSSGSFPGGLTGGNTGGTIGVNAVAFSASGTLQSINFQANGTPATTQTNGTFVDNCCFLYGDGCCDFQPAGPGCRCELCGSDSYGG